MDLGQFLNVFLNILWFKITALLFDMLCYVMFELVDFVPSCCCSYSWILCEVDLFFCMYFICISVRYS